MKAPLLLLAIILLVTNPVCGQFGYISYSSINIGDDIQAIAAKRLLPQDSIPIDRDFISTFAHPMKVDVLVNGYYMSTKNFEWCRKLPPPAVSWPPAKSVSPFFISFHLARGFMPLAFTEEGVKFFKKHEPIGARDYSTLAELHKRGIKAYFSGCLTLTLENPYKKRRDIVYLVDFPEHMIHYLKSKIKGPVEVLTHEVPSKIQYDHTARLKYAENLLEKYRQAKCVVTSKLHVSMPCLAFETPVLLVGTLNERFSGLKELVRHCTEEELLKGAYDFDFNAPAPNSKAYLPLRKEMLKKVADWVDSRKK